MPAFGKWGKQPPLSIILQINETILLWCDRRTLPLNEDPRTGTVKKQVCGEERQISF